MTQQQSTKAVAYCRVSLSEQNPQTQVTNIKEFAANRGLNLIHTYLDHGLSGSLSKEKRPQLDQLIKDARLGKFKVLIVVGLDRVARDVRHLINLLHELDEYGVSLISIRENIDFTTSIGKATMVIIAAVANLELDLIKNRIKTAMAAKKLAAAQAGVKWKCGRPEKLTPELRTEVLKLSASGKSIRVIAEQLGLGKSSVQRVLRTRPITSEQK